MSRWSLVMGVALAHGLASCGSASPTTSTPRVQHGDLPKPWNHSAETPDAPFRDRAPALGSETPFAISKSGPTSPQWRAVLFIERHDLPLVRIGFVVTRGAARCGPGVAGFASAMIFAGTSNRSDKDVMREMSGLNWSTWAEHDSYGLAIGKMGFRPDAKLSWHLRPVSKRIPPDGSLRTDPQAPTCPPRRDHQRR